MNCPHCSKDIAKGSHHWHREARALTDGQRLVTFTRLQQPLFEELWAMRGLGNPLSAVSIARILEKKPDNIRRMIELSVRPKLNRVGLTLRGIKGKHGGYRLVALDREDAA